MTLRQVNFASDDSDNAPSTPGSVRLFNWQPVAKSAEKLKELSAQERKFLPLRGGTK